MVASDEPNPTNLAIIYTLLNVHRRFLPFSFEPVTLLASETLGFDNQETHAKGRKMVKPKNETMHDQKSEGP